MTLALLPSLRPCFFTEALWRIWPQYAVGDGVVYGFMGLWAGHCLRKDDRRHAVWLMVLQTVGIAVATLPTVVATLQQRQAWLGAGCMTASLLSNGGLTLALYLRQVRDGQEFMVTGESKGVIRRAYSQTCLLWVLCLGLWPMLIAESEAVLGWHQWSGCRWGGGLLFILCGVLGLWATWSMAKLGNGTPLPGDCPPRLVTTGPYAIIRNPMALAGIGQAVAVGWFLGSPMVLVYAVLGALAWQWGARPREERDLYARFGEAYWEYRNRVGLWIPRPMTCLRMFYNEKPV